MRREPPASIPEGDEERGEADGALPVAGHFPGSRPAPASPRRSSVGRTFFAAILGTFLVLGLFAAWPLPSERASSEPLRVEAASTSTSIALAAAAAAAKGDGEPFALRWQRVLSVCALQRPLSEVGGPAVDDYALPRAGREQLINSPQWPPMGGWCNIRHGPMLAFVAWMQRTLGVRGGVGEIGIHHGLSFLVLAASVARSEPLFACDVFEKQQHKNIDSSGSGSYPAFVENMAKFGLDVSSRVEVYTGSSLELTPANFERTGPLRLISIDGGHTEEITCADLYVASRALAAGGIAIVDDIYDKGAWQGVLKGVRRYLNETDPSAPPAAAGSPAAEVRRGGALRLLPFFYGWNKLYLADSAHHALYLGALLAAHLFPGPAAALDPSWQGFGSPLLAAEEGAAACGDSPAALWARLVA